jgi:UDP-2,3-diacylglucosamine pyrophosphatase LpxH
MSYAPFSGKAKHGTEVIFVPGNHDEDFREFTGSVFGNLRVERDCLHVTAKGERLLVLHGDEFDSVVKCSPWLAKLGSHAYDFSIEMNRHFNKIRRAFGYPYWSLSGYLKHKVKNAVSYISSFEQAVAARRGDAVSTGSFVGHIRRPEISRIADVLYCNDGDWVESCSALSRRSKRSAIDLELERNPRLFGGGRTGSRSARRSGMSDAFEIEIALNPGSRCVPWPYHF